MTLLDQSWQIELFHVRSMWQALEFEVRSGMRHSKGSVLQQVNTLLLRNGVTSRPFPRKAAALDRLDEYCTGLQNVALYELPPPK